MMRYPKRSPRVFCVGCMGGTFQKVPGCNDAACAFHPYRHGVPLEDQPHRPMKAIRQYCLEYCQAGAGREEVANCQGDTAMRGPCPVFPFRLGRNPNISEATRKKRRLSALERGPVGIIAIQKSRIHGPLQPPESTKAGGAEL